VCDTPRIYPWGSSDSLTKIKSKPTYDINYAWDYLLLGVSKLHHPEQMLNLKRIALFLILINIGFSATPVIANILPILVANPQIKQSKPQKPEEGVEILKGSGHIYDIESLIFSKDGQTLISSSLYNKIHIWNLKTRKLTRTINPGKNGATSLAISPDGQNLYVGNSMESGLIQVWNPKTGKLIGQLNSHKSGISAFQLTADGKMLIVASFDRTVKIWNTQTRKLVHTLKGHNAGVSAIAVSPNGRIIATSAGIQGNSKDPTIRLWDIKTGKILQTLTNTAEGAGFLAFSPDGKNLISARGKSQDYGKTNIWNLTSGKITATIPKSAIFVAFSPDAKGIIGVDASHGVDLWDAKTGANIRQLVEPAKFEDDRNAGREYANVAAISPDYKTLVVGDGGVLSGFLISIRQLSL
jgi:WD40 repeat protein